MNTPLLRPLGIGEILDASLKITFRNFGTLARIVLFIIVPAQVAIAIVDVSAIPNYKPHGQFFASSGQTVDQNQFWTYAATSLIGVLVGFLANQLATGACFSAVAETYLGRKATWRSSLGFAARRFHSIIWVTILGGIVSGLGLLLCVIPGVYLWVSFAVALPVLMSEGQRGGKALGRSRDLIRGRWWKTLAVLIVAGLLASIVGGLVSGAIVSLSFVSGTGPVTTFFIAAVSGTVAALVTTPFRAAYHTVLYFDLRVRKEAFDLRLLADNLGVDPPAGWVPSDASRPPSKEPPFWPPPPGWKPDA